MRESPFTGLMPFTEEQAAFFFGREAEREIITANLMAARLTLLYGPSGVGKSSVLNAGVAYHLRQQARQAIERRRKPEFAIVVFRSWRDDPISSLEGAIAQEIGAPADGATFGDRLRAWSERIDGDVLVILDQFEEYFLYHPAEGGDNTFAVEFPRAVNRPDLRVSFLVSMREDSIAKLDFFKGRISNLFDNYLRIDHLERTQARDAIVEPIAQFNRLQPDPARHVTIDPDLVGQVLDQVAAGRVTVGEGGLGRVTGVQTHTRVETPYLQLVMTRLWQAEAAAGSKVLRTETLKQLGGAEQIVATHLDAALDALTPDEREAGAGIFQYLVTPSGTKIALGVEDLAQYARLNPQRLQELLVKLSSGENRILTPVAPAPDQPVQERYQIFHDVLAAAVLDWRNKYAKAAEQRAAQALALEERRKAEHEARIAGRLRKLLALVAALCVIVTGMALFAWRQTRTARAGQRAANESRIQAEASRAEADSAKHTAEARRLEVLAANAGKEAAEQDAQSQRLRAQAAEAQAEGQVDRSRQLRQQAVAAANVAVAKQSDSTKLTNEANKERAAAVTALAQAEQIKSQTVTGGRSAESPANAPAVPVNAAPVEPRPVEPSPPPPSPAPSTPAASTRPPPVVPAPVGIPGDYKETYKKGINAKNMKRWEEAAGFFQAALQQKGTDTGERLSISGFGNIEPYVPKYYLGLALKNLGKCDEALRFWALSEQDGAIQKTGNLYKALQQGRADCERGR